MAADIATTLPSWSTTAGSNAPAGSTAISTNLDDNLRQIQAVVRTLAASSTIASATTTDLSTINETFVSVTGTTTITALGTLSAGMYKWLIFGGALTFTHNATSLILPTGANITTAAGDVAMVLSLGSGNWRCMGYLRANGQPVGSSALLSGIGAAIAANTIANGDYAQAWQWKLTTAAKSAMKITETTASTGGSGSQYLLDVGTLSASTANPLRVAVRGVDAILVDRVGGVAVSAVGTEEITVQPQSSASTGARLGSVTLAGATTNDGTSGGTVVAQGAHKGTGSAGSVNLTAGASSSASSIGAGQINLTAGTNSFVGTRTAGGAVNIISGWAGGTTGNANGGNVNVELGDGGGTSGLRGNLVVKSASDTFFKVAGQEQHVLVSGSAAPTIASGGGTGPSIAGRDQAIVVTVGTGSPTGEVLINFAQTWTTAPVVCVSHSQATITMRVSTCSTTQVGITPSAAMNSGTKIYIQSMGYE